MSPVTSSFLLFREKKWGIYAIIAYMKRYLQSDWLEEYNIGRICTLFSKFILFD